MKTTIRLTACVLLFVFMSCALLSCGAKVVDGVTVPAGMRMIVSESKDYNLIVPDNWLTDTTVGMTSAYCEDAARSSVSVTANELSGLETTTIEDYWNGFSEQFLAAFPDFEMVDKEPSDVTVGAANEGSETKGVKYRYTATVGDTKYQWMQVLFIRNATIYIMTYTSTAEAYDSHLDDVNNIIAHFSFR